MTEKQSEYQFAQKLLVSMPVQYVLFSYVVCKLVLKESYSKKPLSNFFNRKRLEKFDQLVQILFKKS